MESVTRSPDLAKYTNERYAIVGSFAVLVWDIFLHLPQDYKLATRYRINFLYITYCIARVASLAYLFGFVIILTAPVDKCDHIRYVNILSPFSIPLGMVPLLVRVFALYRNNKYVIAFFSVTWLSVLGASIAVPFGSVGGNIGTTKYCYQRLTPLTHLLLSFCPFIHDSLIFVATSWAFTRNSYSDVSVKNTLRVGVLGRELPPFSRSMLRDGQVYYAMTLLFSIFFVALSYMPEAGITPCAIGIPYFAIFSNMSSYIYRNMRLGFYQDYITSTSTIKRAFQSPVQSHQQHQAMVFRNPTTFANEVGGIPDAAAGGDVRGAEVGQQPEVTSRSENSKAEGDQGGMMEV